jgi:hypothetical protein
MTKQELISQLENAKNNYILGLAGISLFTAPKAYPILEENHAHGRCEAAANLKGLEKQIDDGTNQDLWDRHSPRPD